MVDQIALEAAGELTEALRTFNAATQTAVNDEVALGKTIGTSTPATPDSLAIVSARAQILALTEVVGAMGTLLTKHLLEVARNGE